MQQFPIIDPFKSALQVSDDFSAILSSNLTVYTALVQCTDLLPTGEDGRKHRPKHVELI
jgi:hypothetical protein